MVDESNQDAQSIEDLGKLVAEQAADNTAEIDAQALQTAEAADTAQTDSSDDTRSFSSLDDFFDEMEGVGGEPTAGEAAVAALDNVIETTKKASVEVSEEVDSPTSTVFQGDGLSRDQISKKIDNQRILDTLLRNLVSKRPLSKGDIDTVFGITIRKVVEVIHAEATTLYLLLDDDKVHFAYVYYARALYRGDSEKKKLFDAKRDELLKLTLDRGQGIVGKVFETGEPYCSLDAQNDPNFFSGVDKDTGFITRSMITVPLQNEDGVFGAIQVLNKEPAPDNPGFFDQDDLHLLEEVAEYSCKILERFRFPELEISEVEIASYIARMTKHEHLVITEDFHYEDNLFALVGEENMRKFNILPLKKVGSDALKVAMSNPLDLAKKDNFQMVTSLQIREIVVCSDREIKEVIDRAFKQELSVDMDGVAAEIGLEFTTDAEKIDVDDAASEESAPIVKLGNRIIEDAYSQGASDIHIEPFEDEVLVRYRIDGVCQVKLRLPPQTIRSLIARVKIMAGLNIAEHRLPQDGRIVFKEFTRTNIDIDLRVSVAPLGHGEKVCMRILDKQKSTLPLPALGFSEYNLKLYRELLQVPYGMILHCGPTGSGKSMTLYSALGEVNNPGINIQTAEDPIEYTLKGVNQMQMKKDIGLNFSSALRCFLRQDPDVILVGEIRDLETAEIAVEAALTGHLLFSTLHTNDAPSTVARFLEMGIESFMIASSMVCICAQRLLRRLCKKCKQEYEPSEDELKLLDLIDVQERPTIFHASAKGCEVCSGSGYKGRVGTHELLAPNEEVRSLINQRATTDVIKVAAVAGGMITLHKDTMDKVRQGMTSMEEALMRVTPD